MASPDSDVNSLSSSSSSSSSSAASPANNDVLNGYLKLPNHFVDEGYSNYDDDGSSQESNTKQSETSNSEDSNSSGNDATNAVTSNDNNYATIPPSTTTDISYSYYQQPDRQMYSDLVYANLTNSAPQFQQQQQQQPQQMIQPHMSMDFLRFYYPQYYPHAAPPPPLPPHLTPLPPQSLPGSVYSYGMDQMMMRPMENTWVNKETSGEMNNKEADEGETTANEEENDENDSVSTTSSSNTGASNHLRNIQPRPPAQQQKPTPQPPQQQQQQQHQTGINVPDAEMLAAAVNSKAKARSNAGVGGSRNTKRQRTKFDQHQIELLEAAFNLTHYPDTNQVDRMSTALGLSIERISIWFQNRRAKFKKSAKSGGATQQQQPPKVSADKAPLSIRHNLEIQKTPSYNQPAQATTSSSGMMNQSVTNSCSSLSVTSSPVSNDSSSNSPTTKQSDPQSISKHHQENEEESSDDSSQEDVAAAETRTSGERDAFNMASSLYGNAANLYRPHETYMYPQPQTQSTPSLFQPYMMDKEEPLSPQRHSLHLPMHNPNHLFVYHPQQFVPPPPQQPHFYPQYFPAGTASNNLNQ